MFALDRPLLPKYSKASLNSLSSATSGISSISSSQSISSQNTVTTVICSVPPKANGKTSSRASSAASLGRPYQTIQDEPTSQRKARSAPDKNLSKTKSQKQSKKKSGKNGRQWSADSGVETGYVSMEKLGEKMRETLFIFVLNKAKLLPFWRIFRLNSKIHFFRF